ncbi:MAG: NYN domain-containing protein [Clostridia bacterium]|nr:NYN domain-containing protein [Clostridia bacterium]
MGIGFFKKDKSQSLPPCGEVQRLKAVAFVDYEHWYISLKTNYGLKPNIKAWFEDLNSKFNLAEVNFFADFSHKSLADEIGRIRLFSNKIIDTRSPNGVQKDFTDFIILDNMYQKALSSDDIDVFILFSGDGHFSSATSFLKNFYRKQVVVYAVNGCFSKQLKETATVSYILPTEQDISESHYAYIFDYLKTSSNPTYNDAITAAVKKSKGGAAKQQIAKAMKTLSENNIISERTITGAKGKKQKMLFVDWEKAENFLPKN